MRYLSPLLSDARASIGGATASKNRAGNYFRARIAPVQPRTPAQQAVRSSLASLAASWRGLTSPYIAGWNALAKTVTRTSSLGHAYNPSGEQLYVGNSQNLVNIGADPITAPPAAAPSFPDVTPVTSAPSSSGPSFHIITSLGAAPAGFAFLVAATPQLSAGISFIGKSARRIIGTYPDTDYASINVLADYVARFGDLVAGSTIGIAVSLVEIASGFQSILATATVYVLA